MFNFKNEIVLNSGYMIFKNIWENDSILGEMGVKKVNKFVRSWENELRDCVFLILGLMVKHLICTAIHDCFFFT